MLTHKYIIPMNIQFVSRDRQGSFFVICLSEAGSRIPGSEESRRRFLFPQTKIIPFNKCKRKKNPHLDVVRNSARSVQQISDVISVVARDSNSLLNIHEGVLDCCVQYHDYVFGMCFYFHYPILIKVLSFRIMH